MLKELRAFLLRGSVVDLAVGLVIGAAFGAIVASLVENVITPIIAIPGKAPDFTEWIWTVGNGKNATEIKYGLVLNAIITFILIAVAVFFFVVKPINHLMARYKTEPEPDAPTKPCPECLSSVPEAARRCAFCTSPIGEQALSR